jgi:hypothetical protein
MQSPNEHPTLANEADARGDERLVLLDEINFKWLMAGLGLWIDMVRFHSETSYANHFLTLAEVSDSPALRQSAAALRNQGTQTSH